MLDFAARHDNKLHPLVNEQMANDVYTVLTAFRCINALCVWTFFQPDEYFQSLEPAWQMAFGPESGAWITWASIPSPPGCLHVLTRDRNGNISSAHHYTQHYLLSSIMSSISLWSFWDSSLSSGP